MRQFVAEVNLKTDQMRLLIPSEGFLSKLPDDQEARIRKQYSTGETQWHPPADMCEQLAKARLRSRH